MSLNKLNLLYRAVVLDHAQHPHHKGEISQVTQKVTLHNPSCGDDIQVFICVAQNQISEISFEGQGCTISQASASMMTDVLQENSVSQALSQCEAFFALTMGKAIAENQKEALGDAAVLGSLAEFPMRIKCATLAWHAAKMALEGTLK